MAYENITIVGLTGLQFESALNENLEALYDRQIINTVSVAEFGAVGDGVTDDSVAIQDAFDYANTHQLNVKFERDKTYIITVPTLDFYGGTLEGNNATIKTTYEGGTTSKIISCTGTDGDDYTIDVDAMISTNLIKISDATFLASLNVGDIIVITSEKIFNALEITGFQGETCEVAEILADGINVSGKLNDTYLVSDSAYCMKMTAPTPIIKDLNIIHNQDIPTDDSTYGIMLQKCKQPIIDNCHVLYAEYGAFYISDSYQPKVINSTASMVVRDGLGYGISIFGASTSSRVNNCTIKCARHSVSHGGGPIGVPHDSVVTNVVGEQAFSAVVFDAHAACGIVKWINCTAIGGYGIDADQTKLLGEWDIATTYHTGDIVTRNNVLFQQGLVPDSIGDDPLTENTWNTYGLAGTGFASRSNNQFVLNCTVINCNAAISVANNNNDQYNFTVDGLTVQNCKYGIWIYYNSLCHDFTFDNIDVFNPVYKTGSYLIKIDNATLYNVKFGKITGTNIRGISLEDVVGDVNLKSLYCTDMALYDISGNSAVNVNIEDVNVSGYTTPSEATFALNTINSINITKIYAYNIGTFLFYVLGNINKLRLGTVVVNATGISNVVRVTSGDTLTLLSILNCSVTKGSNISLIANIGTITTSCIGLIDGDISAIYATNQPTLEVISGLISAPYISRGTGSPENVVTAPIGSIYYRNEGGANTSIYVKESGTGSTGWIAK